MKIAINKTVVGKPQTQQEKGRMTFTYENVDLTQAELADSINVGYAFCAQHKDNRRKSTNFTGAGFLAVDIDAGMTINEALAHEFVKDFAALLYTTPSHTDDYPRFRIIFELATPITSAQAMKDAYKGIIKKFGGDPSCKDACRQFFGSKDSNPMIFDNTLPDEFVAELIELGRETEKQTDTADNAGTGRHAIVSRVTLDPDGLIKDAEGIVHRLQDIPERTSVHCPVHADSNPSAFVVKSTTGVVGVHCTACSTTYFTSNDVPLYDFNYRLSNLTELGLDDCETFHEDKYCVYNSKDVLRVNNQYLEPVEINTPITLVKSPKGTGKTFWLEKIVKQCRKEKLSVLLIGHRQSLIQSVAQRLGLTPYIYEFSPDANDRQSDRIKTNAPTKYYAICADSLSTLLNPQKDKYDVVFIDEVEQVFSHLTSNTVKDRRIETFLHFKHYVDVAKQVFVMDADLNELTVNTLHGFLSDTSKTVRFIINEHVQPNRELALYDDKLHLINDLVNAIDQGQRCFVCSNAKKQVKKLAAYIDERFGDSKKVLAITSDNSQESAIQDFIRNIKTAVLDYDVVIVSPSVGTGVDITFPYRAEKIDVVYGFFEARVNTHFDIDQQISRVRHPKEIKVWISPETFRFDTNPEVIKQEVEDTDRSSRQLLEIKPDGTLVFDSNDEYLDLYANVKSMQRGSKNNLRYHFKNLKKHEGWVINEVTRDDAQADSGLEVARRGKELFEAERKHRILNAKLITQDEYKDLLWQSKTQKLLPDEESAMRRYEIESFYYQEVDENLVDLDKDGKRRQQIRQYEQYKKPNAELSVEDAFDEKRGVHNSRSKRGVRAMDIFTTLVQTSKKLGVSAFAYIRDRLSGSLDMPSLAQFILQAAQTTAASG